MMREFDVEKFKWFGLFLFAFYQSVWVLCNIPYLLIEKYRDTWAKPLQKYKIQKNVVNDYEKMSEVFWSELKSQCVIFFPLTLVASHVLAPVLSFERLSIIELCIELLAAIVVHDVTFMVFHVLLHTKYLYKRVHKVHHEYYAPYALTAEHAHPIESIFGFFVPVLLGFVFIVWWKGQLTLHLECVYMVYLSWTSVEGHSGYSFPFNAEHIPLLKWLGGGAIHHDMHHKLVRCNYGSWWLDYLCGTLHQPTKNE